MVNSSKNVIDPTTGAEILTIKIWSHIKNKYNTKTRREVDILKS